MVVGMLLPNRATLQAPFCVAQHKVIVSLFQIDSFIKDMLFFLVTQDAIAKTFIVMYHLFWFYLPVVGKSNLVSLFLSI